jgi:hypothetical protein
VPTEEIVRIGDGLRAERRRQIKDHVRGVKPEVSRQLRLSVEREEQNASRSVDLDSSMSKQGTPLPSLNQDAPPPRYRVIGDVGDTESR